MKTRSRIPPPPRSVRPPSGSPLSDSIMPTEGMVIHDTYRIMQKIGSGGMGDVYLAELARDDPGAGLARGERVAVKMINDLHDSREDAEARFMLEAEAAKKIDSENVIEIYKIGKVGKRIFLVMEFLEGQDLKALIFERGRLSWSEAAPIIEKVCGALQAAHDQNIIHRDMKPENIFLSENGESRVKVLDLGFAKFADEGENDRKLTKGDLKVGTPSYAAPEQIWSESYDRRADLYSLAVVIYEMVTGTVPFRSNSEDERQRIWNVLVKHRDEVPKRPSEALPGADIPKAAEDAIMKALEKDPEKRFQSALEMGEALLGKRIQTGAEGIGAPAEEGSQEAPPRPPSSTLAALLDSSEFGLDTPSKDIPVPEKKPPKEPHSSGWMKGALVGGLISAIAVVGFYNRAKIESFIHSLDEEHQIAPSGRGPIAPPVQAPATFELRVQTEPRGASVYDVTGLPPGSRPDSRVYLGSTPLHVHVPEGERTILIVKRGYLQRRVDVSPSSAVHSITLARPRQRVEQPSSAPAPAEEPAPDTEEQPVEPPQ